ncbi:hypothetical protein BJ508DRAFT_332051 [Ascobolus immersus RN42]|uniref:Uncharacterized protein n=1 Tax=Ascobolus immersus RN42 TaxID=1160509 RepID=A0A3N4I0X4_ASCIM|nr:hypothetical protein BJ508DRAFT_332051 [Ascobolus immersus RN42]
MALVSTNFGFFEVYKKTNRNARIEWKKSTSYDKKRTEIAEALIDYFVLRNISIRRHIIVEPIESYGTFGSSSSSTPEETENFHLPFFSTEKPRFEELQRRIVETTEAFERLESAAIEAALKTTKHNIDLHFQGLDILCIELSQALLIREIPFYMSMLIE